MIHYGYFKVQILLLVQKLLHSISRFQFLSKYGYKIVILFCGEIFIGYLMMVSMWIKMMKVLNLLQTFQ